MDGPKPLVLASTVKFADEAFEIYAVDEHAKGVLQTANHVAVQLHSARSLRRQKSSLFTIYEKRIFDDTFHYTDEAIYQVATLAERVRTDPDASGGGKSMNGRLHFVLRDSPNIHVSSTKLRIASRSLDTAVVSLNRQEGRLALPASEASSPTLNQGELTPPPTYEESTFFAAGRRRNLRRRESALSLNEPLSAYLQRDGSEPSIAELPGDEGSRSSVENSIPTITIIESPPPKSDAYNEVFAPLNHICSPPPQVKHDRKGRGRSQRWLQSRCQ